MNARHAMFMDWNKADADKKDEALFAGTDPALQQYYLENKAIWHQYKTRVGKNGLRVSCEHKGCSFNLYFWADNLTKGLDKVRNITLKIENSNNWHSYPFPHN